MGLAVKHRRSIGIAPFVILEGNAADPCSSMRYEQSSHPPARVAGGH
jgi:hypothetical protein